MSYFNFFNTKSSANTKDLAFIFGCPRGGTTWVWSILESHEDVYPFLLDYNRVNGKYQSSESGIYVRNKKNAKNEIIKKIKKYPNKTIIEKTPVHLFHYQDIKKDFPQSKSIIIFRNPVAIVSSMLNSKMKAFKGYDILKSIEEVKNYYSLLLQIYQLPNSIYLTYENLYDNQEVEINRLLNFLGLSTSSLVQLIEESNTTKISVEGAYRKAKPNSYKEDLSLEEIHLIQQKLKEEIYIFNKLHCEYTSYK